MFCETQCCGSSNKNWDEWVQEQLEDDQVLLLRLFAGSAKACKAKPSKKKTKYVCVCMLINAELRQ